MLCETEARRGRQETMITGLLALIVVAVLVLAIAASRRGGPE
jgi:hypothetical protein